MTERGKRGLNRPRPGWIEDRFTTFYPIGVMASLLNRTVQTVGNWIARGVVPPASMVDSRGRRWFSNEYVNIVRGNQGLLAQGTKAFSARVWRMYKALRESKPCR